MSMTASGKPYPLNKRNKADGRKLLAGILDNAAGAVVFDPQYRGVLDKLKFGNEGERQKRRAELPQMGDAIIQEMGEQIARVLRPMGHVFMWLDKFMLVGFDPTRYFGTASALQPVDVITWNKLTFGMGKRTRRCCEYLMVLQKEPTRAKDVWMDHGIRDVWDEKASYPTHPHSKPYELTRRLITSVTQRGDLVVDPCAGSFMTFDVCRHLNHHVDFLGCDILGAKNAPVQPKGGVTP
jgi:site-specific DNA-methyltransferase (adenine-specific)